LTTIGSSGQRPSMFCRQIPKQDSLDLYIFFETLKSGLDNNDITKLSSLFKFPIPFYLKDSTISIVAPEITKQSFLKNQYLILFDDSFKNLVAQNEINSLKLFSPIFDDKCNFKEVAIGYAPSPNTHKLLFLKRIFGKYKIIGFQESN